MSQTTLQLIRSILQPSRTTLQADQTPLQPLRTLATIDAAEGWMLPENLRLADEPLCLGHDDRAKERQPVASVLGPRFYDWQLAQDPAESWRECELHARNLLGAEGFEKLKAELEGREGVPMDPAPHGETFRLRPTPTGKQPGSLFDPPAG